MAILLKVEWVDRDQAALSGGHIRKIGGSSRDCQWQHSAEQAIRFIEQNEFTYYVNENARILKMEVGIAADGRKFLKTHGHIPGNR
jgi:hypothetical protein